MSNSVQTYAMHDSAEAMKSRGAIRINVNQAEEYNRAGYGIFHTVNCFFLGRKKKDLVSINCWALDIDSGTKEDQMARIKSGLLPTMVIESFRGYHVYWKAKDATADSWNAIVWDRLVPYYGADPNAKDISRILRKPGFYHMKDPANPFMIKKVWDLKVEYSVWEMLSFYKDPKEESRAKREHAKAKREAPMPGSFWDNVWNLNCEYALEKLSGTDYVGCETFSFKQNNSGTKNILVNGIGTSCWVDRDGRIGSFDKGGPTVAQWLNWYHKDYKRVVAIIESEFPECKASQQIQLLV